MTFMTPDEEQKRFAEQEARAYETLLPEMRENLARRMEHSGNNGPWFLDALETRCYGSALDLSMEEAVAAMARYQSLIGITVEAHIAGRERAGATLVKELRESGWDARLAQRYNLGGYPYPCIEMESGRGDEAKNRRRWWWL